MKKRLFLFVICLISITVLHQNIEAKKRTAGKHKLSSSFIVKNKGQATPHRVNQTYLALYYDEKSKSFIQDVDCLIEEGEIVYVYPTQYHEDCVNMWVMETTRFSKKHKSNWFMPVDFLDRIY